MFDVRWERKNPKRWTLKWTFYNCGLFVQIELNYRHSILAFLVFGLIPFIAGVLEQSAVPKAWRRYQDVSSRRTCLGSVMVWAGWSSDPLSEDHRPYAAAVAPPSSFWCMTTVSALPAWGSQWGSHWWPGLPVRPTWIQSRTSGTSCIDAATVATLYHRLLRSWLMP